MKRLTLSLCALCTVAAIQANGVAATDTLISTSVTKQKVVEKGGSGMYRSIVVKDKNLPDYTIYRPRDVKWAAKHEGKLPLLVWANGACSNDNKGYENMLNDLASHGYVVIALGQLRYDDNDASGGTSGSEHVAQAITWMVGQVSSSKSDYYKAVDVNKVALSGHSCGGAEAIANCGNSRVKTLMIMNAGMGGMSMGGASPASLNSLHCPIIYLTGGPDDVAYGNAQTDFNSIKKVGVVWADLSTAGHGGTYWHQHGGDFARIALKWMDWHLKGKTQNASTFLTPDYADFPGWKFDNHNFSAANFKYDAAYDAGTTIGDTLFYRDAVASQFAFGADVSSTSKLEASGRTYLSRAGKKLDLMAILKDQGMNAVRLRVWVSPEGNYCNKADVQKLCTRAKKQSLDVMIDFHYSDFWANGGNQFKPASWEGHSVDQLVTDVYNHTYDVLNTLKKAGVTVRWAQIGNDIENGMLWGDGRIGKTNFIRFINSAYEAIKAANPETQAVLHVAGGQDVAALQTFFDAMQAGAAEWDAIGLSAFPKWSGLKNDVLITRTVESVKALKERYGKPVMIVEAGHYNNKPLESNNFLADFMNELIPAGASGLFYWEPEVVKDYELGAWNPLTNQPSIALDAFKGLKHVKVPYVMDAAWQLPEDTLINVSDNIDITVEARHIRNRIQQVALMEGRNTVQTAQGDTCSFAWQTDTKGLHILYAQASASDGLTATTDSCYVVAGPSTEIGKSLTIENNGIPTQIWTCHLQQPGEYMLLIKYQADAAITDRISLNDVRIATQKFAATSGKATYLTKTFTADEAGTAIFSITPAYSGKVIPKVERFILIPMADQPLPEALDATPVESVTEGTLSQPVYNLKGQRVTPGYKGVVIKNHKKVIQ